MILAPAQLDRHFVQYAHAGRRFARIQNASLQALQLFHVARGLRCHAAHALHDVEQNALGLQQRDHASLDIKGDIARPHMRAVLDPLVERHIRIEPAEHHLGHLDSGQNALLLDKQLHTSPLVGRDARKRRMVSVAYILADSQFDQIVRKRYILRFHTFFSIFTVRAYECRKVTKNRGFRRDSTPDGEKRKQNFYAFL